MESITKKEIIDYLLNKIDEKTEEKFLVKCFSNEENTKKFNIVREDLIENYLSENLSKADRILFETYFLAEPHHQELFHFSKTLRNQLLENKELAIVAKANTEKKPFSIGNILLPIGTLATLLIGVIVIWQQEKIKEIAGLNPTPTIEPISTISPTPIPTITLTPTASPVLSFTPNPKETISPTPKVTTAPTPQISVTPTPKETPKPTPKVIENPVLAFFLPLTPKGGDDEGVLKISKQRKTIVLETPNPEEGFTKYEVIIKSGNITIFNQEFEKDKLIQPSGKINVAVPAENFKSGENVFIIFGKNEDGTTKELRGSERRFKVRKE